MEGSALSDTAADITSRTIARYEKFVNPGMVQLLKFMGLESVEEEAEGCFVTAADGQRYLDCLGGPGVFTAGHRHPRIIAALKAQADKMPLSSHILMDPVMAELAERIAQITPGDLQYSFFCNSGAEAIEGALKAARMHTGRPGFVACHGAFHGKTFGALSASGRDVYKTPFLPLLPGFTHVPFDDLDALGAAVDETTAAVILEPIQCEGGIRVPTDGYLAAAREICDRAGALLIIDEIQTGLGRTGKMWACDWDGVAPDIMTLGKAIGGGVMPMGAFVARPEIWDIFAENPYVHTSTFGGNPLACAVALEALNVLEEENLTARCAERGEQLLAGAKELGREFPDLVTDVRGRGLLVGIEFPDSDIGGLVISGLVQHKILSAFSMNNPEVLRLEPPAVITEEQINTVIAALREALGHTRELLAMLNG
ncbi:MAG: aminotransferase class III-fold pyridoxal phosphate-dependent enzyme [Armatimonadetes bacterium]|nr:aminotransferase class III-fold pyridoxal phosphate-dependent enzyme [Armatimonadota bacterium]